MTRTKTFIIQILLVSAFLGMKAQDNSSKIGILWSTWSVDHLLEYEAYITKMETWGIQYTSINPTYFVDTYEEGVITAWQGKEVTPEIGLQKDAIKALIAHDFYINYRPHIDPIIYAMPLGNERSTWNTNPGGIDWRGLFSEFDPTSPTIGYREKVVLPGLKMLAEAIRESTKKPATPIRFDLGAELMNSMLNYPNEWIALQNEVRELLNTTYSDVKPYISLSHNFCHHIEYLLSLPNHTDYLTRVAADLQLDKSLLFLDRPGVTDVTRKQIGRYIAGLDEVSISQYMPLDIFTPAGQTTSPDDVYEALLWHEDNFIKECLIKQCGIKPDELPVLHIGEYGMGWRGLTAPNVWDVDAWIAAGNGSFILSEAQQKADAAIAIQGILKYVQSSSPTNFRSFLLWFGGAPYDLLGINSYSNYFNEPAANALQAYWSSHSGVPSLTKPDVSIALTADAGADVTKLDENEDGKETITLDASASATIEGNIVSYEWTENDIVLALGKVVDIEFSVGVHSVKLTVTNDNGDTDSDLITVTVKSNNEAPIAKAGSDQFANDMDMDGLETFTLDASNSTDADGSIVSYTWILNGAVIAQGVNPQITLPIGVHSLVLEVADNKGAVGYDDIVLTVNAYNSTGKLIDNFENYTNSSDLQAAWGNRNTNGGDIWGELESTGTNVPQGQNSLKLNYNLGNSGYAGTGKFINIDAAGETGITLDLIDNASNADLLIQITNNGGTYKHILKLDGTKTGTHFIQFSDFDGCNDVSGKMTPGTISMLEFYIEQTTTAGFVYIDNIMVGQPLENNPPVAEAGNDVLVMVDENTSSAIVKLDGSGSSDSDGTIVSYQWTENGASLASGETADVTFPLGKHLVFLTVTDDKGASFTDYLWVEVKKSIALNINSDVINHVAIYPNPATDYIIVNFGDSKTMPQNIKIVDLSGKIVHNANRFEYIGTNRVKVDLTTLPKGIYIYAIQTDDEIFKGKILLK